MGAAGPMSSEATINPPVDLHRRTTVLRLNPRLAADEQQRAARLVASAAAPPGLVWLRSSGTSNGYRLVGLSRRALRCSAEAANRHLEVDTRDVWLLALPDFHVGGLGVLVRSLVSDTPCHTPFQQARWSAAHFLEEVRGSGATLSSLVPTQVFDLVRLGHPCPASLRAVVVGGDALSPRLYRDARALGFPVLPSYGLSECASQVATASLASLGDDGGGAMPELSILPHVSIRTSSAGRLVLNSEALFDGFIEPSERGWLFRDPKIDGWYETEDHGRIRAGTLEVLGRGAHFVKIGGEGVSLLALSLTLEEELRALCPGGDAALVVRPDPRLGHHIALVVDARTAAKAETLAAAYDARVLPFERAVELLFVDVLPRSPLGKLLGGRLEAQLAEYTGEY